MATRRMLLGLLASGALPGLARSAPANIEIPFRVTRNSPWSAVVVNNKDPLAFLIDTGSNVFGITPGAAEALDLTPLGKGRLQALVGRMDVPYYEATEVIIGGAMRERNVLLAGMRAGRRDLISGIIPSAKFGVMGLDFDRQMMVMARAMGDAPEGYHRLETFTGGETRGSAARLGRRSNDEVVVNDLDQRPVVHAELDGQPLRLLVDTGAQSSLLLSPDYVKAKGLWDSYPKSVETGISTAARGARARLVKAGEFKLGPYVFQTPVVTLTDPADHDQDGSDPVDGLIGMELLRRFNFLHHTARRVIYLKPSQALHDVYRHDRGGIAIDLTETGIAVTWLREGGPAAKAGLTVGDKVTGWRGRDGYYGLMWALHGPAGSRIEIQVVRDGKPTMVTVTLEELI